MREQDPYRKERLLWFTAMNLIAIGIALGFFAIMLFGDSLNRVVEPFLAKLFEHKVLVVAIAMSPLFASLLVGMAYAQRAIRRKRQATTP